MALTQVDRDLIRRCLAHQPGAWNDFVDRFLGLIYHVVRHTAHLRSIPLRPEDNEDLVAEVLLHIVSGDYALLRQFRGKSSLATYLTVIARRICVHALASRAAAREVQPSRAIEETDLEEPPRPQGLRDIEEVEKLLRKLPSRDREVVRLRYLEGRSYEEISSALGIPINSIGAILSRARARLRSGKSSDRHAGKSNSEKAAGDKHAGDKPASDKPAGDKPAGDKPSNGAVENGKSDTHRVRKTRPQPSEE